MMIHPSRHQRYLLMALYLSLLWLVSNLLVGWQWALFVPVWLVAFYFSWNMLNVPPLLLQWDGQRLEWQGVRYQLGKESRILPGVLRLSLYPERGAPRSLWLFSDALPPDHYRLLARAVNFPTDKR